MNNTDWNNNLTVLFARLRDKDEEALSMIISHYKRGMIAFITSIVGNPQDAEAIFFEAIEYIFLNPKCVKDPTTFSGFLRTAVRNSAYNFIDTAEKRHTVNETDLGEDEYVLDDFLGNYDSPEYTLEKKELKRMITQILKNMDPRYSKPLYEQYYNDLSLSDIAKKLHLPRSTVIGRLQTGKKLLRGYQHIVQERYGYRGYEQ